MTRGVDTALIIRVTTQAIQRSVIVITTFTTILAIQRCHSCHYICYYSIHAEAYHCIHHIGYYASYIKVYHSTDKKRQKLILWEAEEFYGRLQFDVYCLSCGKWMRQVYCLLLKRKWLYYGGVTGESTLAILWQVKQASTLSQIREVKEEMKLAALQTFKEHVLWEVKHEPTQTVLLEVTVQAFT
jgi:hypothetical protein